METISSITQLDTPFIKVHKNAVELPYGTIIDDYYTVTVQNSAAVVALTDKREIVLIKQYRYCYDTDLIELPSGVFEEHERDSLIVAKRELLEETGYQSEDWTYLGATIENPAQMTNHNHLFIARDCKRVSEQKLDATENVEVLLLPFEKAVDMVMNNRICCSSTAQGILKAARLLN